MAKTTGYRKTQSEWANLRTQIKRYRDIMNLKGGAIQDNLAKRDNVEDYQFTGFHSYNVLTKKQFEMEKQAGYWADEMTYKEALEGELVDIKHSYGNLERRTGLKGIDFRQEVELRDKHGNLNPNIDWYGEADGKAWNSRDLDIIGNGQKVSRFLWVRHNVLIDLLNPDEEYYY